MHRVTPIAAVLRECVCVKHSTFEEDAILAHGARFFVAGVMVLWDNEQNAVWEPKRRRAMLAGLLFPVLFHLSP